MNRNEIIVYSSLSVNQLEMLKEIAFKTNYGIDLGLFEKEDDEIDRVTMIFTNDYNSCGSDCNIMSSENGYLLSIDGGKLVFNMKEIDVRAFLPLENEGFELVLGISPIKKPRKE